MAVVSEAEKEEENADVTLSALEKECLKQNFRFYEQANTGSVERFELPLVLEGKLHLNNNAIACGYSLTDKKMKEDESFLDEKQVETLSLENLIAALAFSKQQDLMTEQENDLDEYLEAFVALGGQANKEGFVSKEVLIQIIKLEFEMTLDLEEYLRKSGGDTDEIAYYQFCRLLDAGTGGNASRISSFVSQNKGSSFMRFSYFNDRSLI